MKQAHIQQLRRLVADEITYLHEHKRYLKEVVSKYWKLSDPNTEEGRKNFCYLSVLKSDLKGITEKIQKLSLLIKALKKEEKYNSY